jgi:2'-5' RNA ligase
VHRPGPSTAAADPADAAPVAGAGPAGGVVRIGVAVGVPQPWGGRLDRDRAAAGDPLAELIPSHVTLLGPTDVDPAALPSIEKHLAEVAAGHRPFTVQLRGTGTFRPVTEVVFVALATGIGDFELLAQAVRTGPLYRELEFPYHPHVTVAHDLPAPALDTAFERFAGYCADFEVDHFTLYVHGTAGRWRPVRDFPLAGR